MNMNKCKTAPVYVSCNHTNGTCIRMLKRGLILVFHKKNYS